MAERYFHETLKNGLTLLMERMPEMTSAAMTFLVPAGVSNDREGETGTATVLADLVLRGAGNRDNRQLTEYLDGLGLQRSAAAGIYHTRFGCAAVADKVVESLKTYADIVRRPKLPEAGFGPARELAIQSLEGIEDEPRQKLSINLREKFFPKPLGRNTLGTKDDLEGLTLEKISREWNRRYRPDGAILALAGNVDFDVVKSEVEKHFGDWTSNPIEPVKLISSNVRAHHEQQESEQTHIGIAYPSILETDSNYYVVRLFSEVLGGGMSGRLFTEVREKRGLCYNVWAGYQAAKEFGCIMGYSGTSNERAQDTLDCIIAELHRLSDGITEAELARAKTGLKANLIMQGESTSGRAGAIAGDYFIRGRIRSLDEIKSAIDSVTLGQVNAYLKITPPGPFTIVTVGPKELKLPG